MDEDETVLRQERQLTGRFDDRAQSHYRYSAKDLHQFYILNHLISSLIE